jgi:hypothetical protein
VTIISCLRECLANGLISAYENLEKVVKELRKRVQDSRGREKKLNSEYRRSLLIIKKH